MGYNELYEDKIGDLLGFITIGLLIIGILSLVVFAVFKIPQAWKCRGVEYDYVDYNHNTGKAKSCKVREGILSCETKDGKVIQVLEYSRPICEK